MCFLCKLYKKKEDSVTLAENDQEKLKASETLQKLTSLLKASAYF